jgi:hypothetical protein
MRWKKYCKLSDGRLWEAVTADYHQHLDVIENAGI